MPLTGLRVFPDASDDLRSAIPPERHNADHCPTKVSVRRWVDGAWQQAATDEVAAEEPMEIRVRGRAISVTMRTPGHDHELALGFLFTEGVIREASDVVRIEPCPRAGAGQVVNVFLKPEVPLDLERLTRHVFASSSCGVCGKASIDAVCTSFPSLSSPTLEPEGHRLRVKPEVLQAMPDALRSAQSTFERTGGLHAAALFDASGELKCVREDVGRHNAVDKAIGWQLANGDSQESLTGLLVSGRTSFEILLKALAARFPLVAAVSAPSSMAVDLAQASGITLVGFLRPGRLNVYSHAERIEN